MQVSVRDQQRIFGECAIDGNPSDIRALPKPERTVRPGSDSPGFAIRSRDRELGNQVAWVCIGRRTRLLSYRRGGNCRWRYQDHHQRGAQYQTPHCFC